MTAPRRSPLAALLLGVVHLYRATAAMRSPRCRFAPSCSTYAVTCLRDHGALRGGWLALRRLLRCHPWNPGGVDHPPPPPRAGRDGATPSVGGLRAPEDREDSVPDRPHVRK